jgi:hypothetical protein
MIKRPICSEFRPLVATPGVATGAVNDVPTNHPILGEGLAHE